MRTATNSARKSAPVSRAKLSKKAKRPVKAATLASEAPARSIGETQVGKGQVALKTICADIGINPKVARRELRKHRKEAIETKEKNALREHSLHTRWIIVKGSAQEKEIRSVLKAYVERNGAEE